MSRFTSQGVLILAASVLLFGCTGKEQEQQVSFQADVQPILKEYCSECHLPGGRGTIKTGLEGTDSVESSTTGVGGITTGNSGESRIV